MLRTLRCKNYKVFDAEVTIPTSPLTVLVGPNNGGKSTVLDLAELTKQGRSLALAPENDRFRDFESLLGENGESLQVGRRMSADIAVQVGPGGQRYRLADDIAVQAEFATLGEGNVLTRRDLYLCPAGAVDSKRRRVVSEIYEVGPPQEQEASLRARSGGSGGRKDSQTGESWFGIPWEEGEAVRSEQTNQDHFQNRGEAELRDPYYRWVSRTLVLEESFVRIGTRLFNDSQRSSGDAPISFSEDEVEFRVEQKEQVPTKESPPEQQFLRPDVVVREHLESPDWVVPNQSEAWEIVRRDVLAPLLKKMNQSLVVDPDRMPFFRARPEFFYGPEAPMSSLLRDFQRAHPAVREEVKEWIKKLQIGSDLRVEAAEEDLYAPSVKRRGQWRSLSEMGAGTAQLLPLILRLSERQVSNTILVEEPEAHLHPKLQARIADLMVDVMMRGHQVIVETHSEHLVRRLQYLIAKEKLEPSFASLLYVDAPGKAKGSPVQPLTIDNKGQLSATFGSNFFDESSRLSHLFRYGTEN